MRIVIILCPWPTPRKVLRPETLDRNSSDEARKPWGAPVPHFNFARNSLTTPSNFEFTSLKFCGFLPVVNLSDHRITCEIGDERAEREIPELRQIPHRSRSPPSHSPNVHRRATPTHTGRHAYSIDELARNDIKFSEISRSAGERSRPNRRIVTACARLRRWCARSHFALQLLGF